MHVIYTPTGTSYNRLYFETILRTIYNKYTVLTTYTRDKIDRDQTAVIAGIFVAFDKIKLI